MSEKDSCKESSVDYGSIAKFITEHAKETSKDGFELQYQVPQSAYQDFLKEQGVPKDVLKQVTDAQAAYANGNVEALSKILTKNKAAKRATINTRTPGGVVSIRMTREYEARNPTTGDKTTKYGTVSMKIKMKSQLSKDLVEKAAKAVEKACK